MKLSRILLLWLALALPQAAYSKISAGTLQDLGTVKSAHADARRVTVWLPSTYRPNGPRHAVLYAHDGQNLFDPETGYGGNEWKLEETLDRLIREKKVRPTIVVAIWNTPKRMQEYALPKAYPTPDLQKRAEAFYKGPLLSDGYLKFIATELKPLIDAKYRTRRGRADTFVMGSSMGGLISLYALAEYPDLFGGAASLSTHWPLAQPNDPEKPTEAELELMVSSTEAYLSRAIPAPGKHRVYFDYGAEWTDARYYPLYQSRMDALMRKAGWSEQTGWISRYFPGQPHNEASWASRVEIPLRFLLAPVNSAANGR